jgi:protein-tyrosine kinase
MERLFKLVISYNQAVEEAYKTVRTNVQFCCIDKMVKTITVTSATPSEGKTTTCINLAASMAAAGLQVLIVDADLRKPVISKRLGSGEMWGITNYIAGKCSAEEVITRTDLEGVDLVASGPKPPNPAEIIGSAKFTELVLTLSSLYDIVILDTPPLGSVIDAALISSLTDGTILVVKSKAVNYKSAVRVKEQLEKVEARILGVILNHMDKSFYRDYYNYYNYYYSDKPGKKSVRRLKKASGTVNEPAKKVEHQYSVS